MALIARSEGGNYKPVDAGTHRAVCVQVIDIGTQYSKFYDKSSRKIIIGWELADEDHDDRGARLIWNRYTLSLHENSALRSHLESWRGRSFTDEELEGFVLDNLIGKSCQLSIVHSTENGKTFANVNGVTGLAKSMQPAKATVDTFVFELSNPDQKIFDTFREGLQKTISNSDEGAVLVSSGKLKLTATQGNKPQQTSTHSKFEGVNDDIPF